MKNLKKLFVSLVCLALFVCAFPSIPTQAMAIRPFAWAGRPGGNGTGSEEWLQGSYGEMDGPWRVLCTSTGSVSALNTISGVTETIVFGIMSALSGGSGTSALVKNGIITSANVASIIYGSYSGNYYKSTTYISGRCMKAVIITYNDKACTDYVRTYGGTVIKW